MNLHSAQCRNYRGRIAPTPTGYLHLGHAATFSTAFLRAQEHQGQLIFRMEDIDPARCHKDYAAAALDDLTNWGINWTEGPDKPGANAPYYQSQRHRAYIEILDNLRQRGLVYPCRQSRKSIRAANPQLAQGEPIFPKSLRPDLSSDTPPPLDLKVNWRFRIPDETPIIFQDIRMGQISFTPQKDFGDFLVWRKDEVPAYELAVVVDDYLMEITEVVRGQDLLLSTARQLLIFKAMGWTPPNWYHAPLIVDSEGNRLSKTVKSLSLKRILEMGHSPRFDFNSIQQLALKLNDTNRCA